MSGSNTVKWSPEQRRAVQRAVIDEGLKVPAVEAKAIAGELRPELADAPLDPFAMPKGTIHRIVAVERKRRRAMAVEAQAINDPDAYSRAMLLQLMAEANHELLAMNSWLRSGRKRPRKAAWDDIAAAAKTIENIARASAQVNGKAKAPTPVQTPVEEPKRSLVSSLAKQRPSKADATTERQEPTTGAATHVSSSAEANGTAGAVPSYALREA